MGYVPPFVATEAEAEILGWVHEFAEKEIRPVAAHYDEVEHTPWPVIEKAHEVGLYSLDFITEVAANESGVLLPAVLEEVAWGDAGIALALFGTTLSVTALMSNGTPKQVGEWLPQMFEADGKPVVAAFCSSEANAGSDVSGIRTRAVRNANGDWVLNGTKAWATNGGIANVHLVVASVDPDLGSRGHAVFVVPPGTPGLSQGQKVSKHGIRASHTAEVILDNVILTDAHLLGGPEKLEERLARARARASAPATSTDNAHTTGNGAMATFEASRPAVGALALGIARAATEYACEYTTTREQFGKPIAANQGVAFTLAEMATRTDAARLLVHRAATMARHEIPFTRGEGSMSKLAASEAAVWVTGKAIQLLGGNGYAREYPVERWARDARIFTIFEGTSEIQRSVIARALTGVRNF